MKFTIKRKLCTWEKLQLQVYSPRTCADYCYSGKKIWQLQQSHKCQLKTYQNGEKSKPNIRNKQETNQVQGQICPPVSLEPYKYLNLQYYKQFWSQFLLSVPDLENLLIQFCHQEKMKRTPRVTKLVSLMEFISVLQSKQNSCLTTQLKRIAILSLSSQLALTAYRQFIFPTLN